MTNQNTFDATAPQVRPHEEIRRPGPHSTRGQCQQCGELLPRPPFPVVDLDDLTNDMAWAVAIYKAPAHFPGIIALAAADYALRNNEPHTLSWWPDLVSEARQSGMTPREWIHQHQYGQLYYRGGRPGPRIYEDARQEGDITTATRANIDQQLSEWMRSNDQQLHATHEPLG